MAYYLLTKSFFTPIFIYCAFEAPFKIFYVLGFLYRAQKQSDYELQAFVLGIYCITEVMFLIWAIIIFKLFSNKRFFVIKNLKVYSYKLHRLQILFFVCFIIAFILLTMHSYGFLNWLQNPRAGYLYHRDGAGVYYALALTSLSIVFLSTLFTANKPKMWFLYLLGFLFVGYFLGTKDLLVTQVQCFFMLLWFKFPKLAIRYTIIGAPITALLLAVLFIVSNETEVLQILLYFDYFYNASLFYRDYLAGNVQLFYGEIMLTDFWRYFPRSIFPDKPYVYGPVLVADLYYPGAAKNGAYPAFGAGVFQFADYGWFGIIILTLFDYWPWFFAAMFISVKTNIFKNVQGKQTIDLFSVVLFLFVFAPNFGLFFPGFLFMILILLSIVTFSITTRLKWKRGL